MEKYNEQGKVICQECGKAFNIISPTHLGKSHSMTLDEYRKRYDGFPVASQSFGAKQKFGESTLLNQKPEEIPIEPTTEFDLDKIPIISKDIKDSVNDFLKEVKDFSREVPTEKISFTNQPNIHKSKAKLLNFLSSYFPDIKNSFFIEKYNIAGSLQYRLVTDICSPVNQIDFEFPDAFWHNKDIPKNSRDLKLKADGWKIIDVKGPSPTIVDMKKILVKNNLIWLKQ